MILEQLQTNFPEPDFWGASFLGEDFLLVAIFLRAESLCQHPPAAPESLLHILCDGHKFHRPALQLFLVGGFNPSEKH